LNAPLVASAYDDDPQGAPGSPFYHVSPNLNDSPLRTARNLVFVADPAGIAWIENVIRTQGTSATGPNGGIVVFREMRASVQLKTGTACVQALGDPTTPGSASHGLVATGQQSSADVATLMNGCQQQKVGLLDAQFPVSIHLPPGWYDNCVILHPTSGPATVPYCSAFRINAVTGYSVDIAGLDFGTLSKDTESIDQGDFDTVTAHAGTIVSIGNTSPVFAIEFSWMRNGTGPAAAYIKRGFGMQIQRRNAAGLVVASQKITNLAGEQDPDAADPFLGSTKAVLDQICLEPGEPLRLDFSVTPRDPLVAGPYVGKMRISVATSAGCVPGLGQGESASGDDDGNPYNNLPGVPVSTVNRSPLPTGTPTSVSAPSTTGTPTPTDTSTPTATGAPTSTPTPPATGTPAPTSTPTPPSPVSPPAASSTPTPTGTPAAGPSP
jgi:hypothetical protein